MADVLDDDPASVALLAGLPLLPLADGRRGTLHLAADAGPAGMRQRAHGHKQKLFIGTGHAAGKAAAAALADGSRGRLRLAADARPADIGHIEGLKFSKRKFFSSFDGGAGAAAACGRAVGHGAPDGRCRACTCGILL